MNDLRGVTSQASATREAPVERDQPAHNCHDLDAVRWLRCAAVWLSSLHRMALGGKHSLPGFERSLEELRADILLMASLVRRSLGNAKKGLMERDEDDCSAT